MRSGQRQDKASEEEDDSRGGKVLGAGAGLGRTFPESNKYKALRGGTALMCVLKTAQRLVGLEQHG